MRAFKSGREAVAALPKTLAVGAFEYTIEPWNAHEATAEHRYGEHVAYRLTIRIREDIPSAQKAADTLLHEVLHAIWFTYGIWDDDKQERTVAALSTALVALYRHNPWLSPWLARCLG